MEEKQKPDSVGDSDKKGKTCKNSQRKCTKSKKSCKDSNINISQHIEVGDKDIQCVINLNTNVCRHKSNKERSSKRHRSEHSEEGKGRRDRKSIEREYERRQLYSQRSHRHYGEGRRVSLNMSSKDTQFNKYSISNYHSRNSKDRIVPTCYRQVCWYSVELWKDNARRRKLFQSDEIKACKPKEKTSNLPCNDVEHRMKSTKSHILLSPISSSSLPSVTYENISSSSLHISDATQENSSGSRHHRKKCSKHRHKKKRLESKLDTLIKRAKERERQMVALSRKIYSSTPIVHELSPDNVNLSCSDMDINSVSTMVLKIDTPHRTRENSVQPISPKPNSSSINNRNTPMLRNLIPLKGDRNVENVQDVGVYSPNFALDISPNIRFNIKKEVKEEPLFSSELSPIIKDNDGLELGSLFCKQDDVKNEHSFL